MSSIEIDRMQITVRTNSGETITASVLAATTRALLMVMLNDRLVSGDETNRDAIRRILKSESP